VSSDRMGYPPGRGHEWRGDWGRRIFDLLGARGYARLTDFAAAHPNATIFELARELGVGDVAPIQVQWILVDEAREVHDLERCARDLLNRRIREVGGGWPADQGWETQKKIRGALIAWQGCLKDEKYEAALGKMVDELLDATDIPSGWLPSGADDERIAALFRRHWPDTQRAKR